MVGQDPGTRSSSPGRTFFQQLDALQVVRQEARLQLLVESRKLLVESFANCTRFIYKTVCVPTKITADSTPAFVLLSRSFQSAIPFQRAGGQAATEPMATGGFVGTITIVPICAHPNPVVGFDNL